MATYDPSRRILTDADVVRDEGVLAEALRAKVNVSEVPRIFAAAIPVTVSASSAASISVSFGSTFNGIPAVTATSENSTYFCAVTNITPSSCLVRVRHHLDTSATTTVSVQIIAAQTQ